MAVQKQITQDPNDSTRNIYLLGIKNGIYYWLKEPMWVDGYHWGFGYVESYPNQETFNISTDNEQHLELYRMFFQKNGQLAFKTFFDEIPFTDEELSVFIGLMRKVYTCKSFADICSGHNNDNPEKNKLINNDMYTHVNNYMLPIIFNELRIILSP